VVAECFVIHPFDNDKFDRRFTETFKAAIEPATNLVKAIKDGTERSIGVFADRPTILVGYGETQMAVYRNQSLLCFGVVKFLMSLFLILYGASLPAQTLEIRLLDGRDGRPMIGASSYVNVWVGTERKEAIAIPADENGVARLQLTLNTGKINIPNSSKNRGSIVVDHPVVNYNESFRINIPYVLCGSGESNYSWLGSENFSTKEILQHGYVSPNICGKATVPPQPGQVILFVRPLTWREKLKQ
jgi:hypothetical protein